MALLSLPFSPPWVLTLSMEGERETGRLVGHRNYTGKEGLHMKNVGWVLPIVPSQQFSVPSTYRTCCSLWIVACA
jgi:hypothetical protein